MISKKKKIAMIDSQLSDTVWMTLLTGGDPELMAIDQWLRDGFEDARNNFDNDLISDNNNRYGRGSYSDNADSLS